MSISRDEFMKIYAACFKAVAEMNEKPGTFDLAFGDMKDAISKSKQTALTSDIECRRIVEWFEKVEQDVKEIRRVRDMNIRRAERIRRDRNYKRTGGIRVWDGGSCSGN